MHKYLFSIFATLVTFVCSFEPIIILVGPPGVGKGTFSQYLKEQYEYNHISAGDLVRQEILKRTSIGIEIEEIVARGDFILSATMRSLMRSAILDAVNEKKSLIIDGFCRNDGDSVFLYDLLSELGLLERAIGILLQSDDSGCQKRISDRQVCSTCAHVYHRQYAPSKVVDVCDLCQIPLARRINDTPAVISKRIQMYRSEIGEIQARSITFYPHLLFFTDRPLSECLQKYSEFAKRAAKFTGSVDAFVEEIAYPLFSAKDEES